MCLALLGALPGLVASWQQFLSRFDFEWEYRKGCHNVADPISRSPALHAMQAQQHAMQAKDQSGPALNVMPATQAQDSGGDAAGLFEAAMEVYDSLNMSTQFLHRVCNGYAQDPWFADAANTAELTFIGDYWRKGELIMIPDMSDLRMQCLSLHHDTPYAGHLRRDRTNRLIMQTKWWPSVDSDVRHYVSTFDFCRKTKPPMRSPLGCCSRLQYQSFVGKVCPWISSLNCLKYKQAIQLFWCL